MSEPSEQLESSLRDLAIAISAHNDVRNFSDHWGWQAPSINKQDLSDLTSSLADKVASIEWDSANEATQESLKGFTEKARLAKTAAAANLFSGPQAAVSICTFLTSIELKISSVTNPEQIKNTLSLPIGLRKNVSLAKKRLSEATAEIDGIETKLTEIKSAHSAAERLPITQHDLEQAVIEVTSIRERIVQYEATSKELLGDIEKISKSLASSSSYAEDTLQKVGAAYRAATSEGLAKAFDKKARELNNSLFAWLSLLISALAAAAYLGWIRFPAIIAAISGTPQWGTVAVHSMLGAFTMAAPIWLAWVSTKQIGQRFRLSEDYAYKSALASAYEGYRSEAARLDELFEAQLFAIAINRLDEIPLRLIEQNVAGSPLHELISSAEFKSAIEKTPGLKARIVDILRRNPKPSHSHETKEPQS